MPDRNIANYCVMPTTKCTATNNKERSLLLNPPEDKSMPTTTPKSRFETELFQPAKPGKESPWSFLILPKLASDTLPRRGRTTIEGTLNGHPFQATLEPDGKFSHWLKVPEKLREAAGAQVGEL